MPNWFDEWIEDNLAGGGGSFDVIITSTPTVSTTATGATIAFTSTDAAEASVDGGAYAPATSPIVLAGLSLGAHTVDVRSIAHPTVHQTFAWTVIASGFASATLVSSAWSPATRFQPVVQVYNVTAGDFYVILVSGLNRIVIRDPADVTVDNPFGFTPQFKERSSISINGSLYTVSMLPSGGWWMRNFEIRPVSGAEIM